ncbi:MAG TPA: helix-turn-helix transcriptional regulator [Thermoanaerobaculia bacterium]|nr:helix-turn-helix transcriptional regulator [Thermoanaerobaculia bacterium]
MGSFSNLGQALRWLRTRQSRKQYEIAEEAGITKAMLSSYETGKQSPSIETLEKILDALHVDLADLHYSLLMHQSSGRRPELETGSEAWHAYERERMHSYVGEPRVNIYRVLEIDHPLPPEQERAMSEMLHGFHSLVRHMYNTLRRSTRPYGGPEPPYDNVRTYPRPVDEHPRRRGGSEEQPSDAEPPEGDDREGEDGENG